MDNRLKGGFLIIFGIAIITVCVRMTLQEGKLLFLLIMGVGALVLRAGLLSLFPTMGKFRGFGKGSRRNR